MPYSFDITGSVVDDAGMPIAGASVVTMVYKNCGSLGGKASQRLTRTIVKTDAAGRYRDKLKGVSLMHFALIEACHGYEHHTVACKAGFKPSRPAMDPGDNVLRLEPGAGWTHLEMPPECANQRLIEEAQAQLPVGPSMPPPVKGSVNIPLWKGKLFLQVGYADPSEGQSPSVGIAPDVPSQAHWLIVRESINGGSTHRYAVLERGHGYTSSSGFLGSDTINTYVFLLKDANPNSPLFDESRRSQVTARMVRLEPVGGVRWTISASGSNRTGARMIPVAATKEDWIELREAIAGTVAPAMAAGYSLHAPLEMTLKAKASAEKRVAVRPTGQRMTMPLWQKGEWIYPTVVDRGGLSAPYPGMPLVKIEASRTRLIAVERVLPSGARQVEISLSEPDFFFTKNYAAADGRYRTCIFDLARPDPTAMPLLEGGERESGLAPRGGIAWDLMVEGGARKEKELELEPASREDWARLRGDIVAFIKREKRKGINLFDPAPPPVRYTLMTWAPGIEVHADVHDAGSPGMPKIKIPFYGQIGAGWITVEEYEGEEPTAHVAFSRDTEYAYEGKAGAPDGTLTVYLFPTWLARHRSTPIVEFPDEPVQYNDGGMVFERGAAFEPVGALTWKIVTRKGVRAGGPIRIAAAGPEAWRKFRPRIVELNRDMNGVKQRGLTVFFDPQESGVK